MQRCVANAAGAMVARRASGSVVKQMQLAANSSVASATGATAVVNRMTSATTRRSITSSARLCRHSSSSNHAAAATSAAPNSSSAAAAAAGTSSSSSSLFASFTSEPLPPGPEITDQLVNAYASRKARPVSLQEMMVMGSNPAYLLTAAQWLWEELPVRLAKRLRDLDDLPFGLSKSVEVQSLAQLYRLSLRDALACPRPQNSADELRFTEQVLKRILVRHQEIVVDLAAGINLTSGFLDDSQLQPVEDNGGVTEEEGGGGPLRNIGREDAFGERPLKQHFILQEFLDNFNAARIGLRLLMAQHVALHNPLRPNFVGVIQRDVDPAAIVARAAEDAAAVCKAQWGVAPAVEVIDQAKKQRAAAAAAGGETSGGGITNFHYVPAHLRAMLFELLKNAMHATVEHARFKRAASVVPGTAPALDHVRLSEGTPPATSSSPSSLSSSAGPASPSSSLPPSSVSVKALTLPSIRVVIVDGATDVTIKVSDEGGGIRRQDLGRVFTYTYSAVQRSRAQRRAQQEAAERQHKKMCEAAEAAALAQGNANGAHAAAAKVKMDGIAPSAKLAGAALSSSASSSSPTSSPSAPAAGTAAAPASGGGEAPVLVAAQTLQQRNGDFSWLTGSNFEPVLNTAVNDFGDAFGLPITRLYARCLGGDLQLRSLHGYGTDAFLYLSKIGDFKEPVN